MGHMPDIEKDGALRDYRLAPKSYAVLTLHMAENVDDSVRLGGIIRAILDEDLTIVYPCHPGTRIQLERTGLLGDLKSAGNVQLLEPVPYFRIRVGFRRKHVPSAFPVLPCGTIRKDSKRLK